MRRFLFVLLALALLSAVAVPAVRADGGPLFTLTAASTYIRGTPSFSGEMLFSAFKGQTFDIIGRTADNLWVLVRYGPSGEQGWISTTKGVWHGDLGAVPVAGGPPAATSAASTARPELPAWVPVIGAHMREVWEQSPRRGRNQRRFALTGDCNSEYVRFTDYMGNGLFDVSPYPYLKDTRKWFLASFQRHGVAASGGFNAASVMDPLWADPTRCRAGESAWGCELRLTRASLAVIAQGTGDHYQWREFEANYRRLIEYALGQGALPLLITKADDLDSLEAGAPRGYINDVIRHLGQEYDVPVLDLYAALQPLENHGLLDEPGNDFHLSGDGTYIYLLSFLQTLDVIRH